MNSGVSPPPSRRLPWISGPRVPATPPCRGSHPDSPSSISRMRSTSPRPDLRQVRFGDCLPAPRTSECHEARWPETNCPTRRVFRIHPDPKLHQVEHREFTSDQTLEKSSPAWRLGRNYGFHSRARRARPNPIHRSESPPSGLFPIQPGLSKQQSISKPSTATLFVLCIPTIFA